MVINNEIVKKHFLFLMLVFSFSIFSQSQIKCDSDLVHYDIDFSNDFSSLFFKDSLTYYDSIVCSNEKEFVIILSLNSFKLENKLLESFLKQIEKKSESYYLYITAYIKQEKQIFSDNIVTTQLLTIKDKICEMNLDVKNFNMSELIINPIPFCETKKDIKFNEGITILIGFVKR